jgi:glycine dehydrogenase
MNTNSSFARRHIGPGPEDTSRLLDTVGVASLDSLIRETIPESIRLRTPLRLPPALSEHDLIEELRRMAGRNRLFKTYIGMGYYGTLTPAVIQRNVLENPAWYTSYTPYQAEISQGRLEALLNYQTMVVDLTAMDMANASLLDEGTAAAEAMHMFHTPGEAGRNRFFVSHECLPQTIDVLRTRASSLGIELVLGDFQTAPLDRSFFGALLQYPTCDGTVHTYGPFCDRAHAAGVSVAVAADPMSLALLEPPGAWGADAVVGSTQRFGIPMGYGGPHAAFFAVRDAFKRKLPGRLIGVTIDARGQRALRMTLQTREQHIRREKATSNICTSQVLLANMAGLYAVYHGPDGIRRIATTIHERTAALNAALQSLGYAQRNPSFFDTLRIECDESTVRNLRTLALQERINLRYIDTVSVGVSIDETTSVQDVEHLAGLFAHARNQKPPSSVSAPTHGSAIPSALARTRPFLQHPVFNRHHSETDMLRYIKSLELKDFSLANGMIPLGSCTMKLNAATEMFPITWPEFASLHPFVPREQAEGYAQLFSELESYLNEITGFAATSLQPNAGAQGEYTGLMVIREYLKRNGRSRRNVALIPSSAHGTNPASAAMAGMQVVVVRCDEEGNIDVQDLKEKAQQHRETLACLMVTYPSTHGVFEESIREICRIVHDHGGQVYMDGANMNAQVGLTNPAIIGADVCHINLHKTFCIPHGGGGPGMGPICVARHLAPFLPKHPVVPVGGEQGITAVAAAPWGSADILLISYAYIRLMGPDGLADATRYAILNANYIKERLNGHYRPLYVGKNGRVGHEMILDTRPFKASAGIDVTDIAKRLMDYGFHAPTVSFPVPGTLMVEPTESEPLEELDRFCDAMISIRKEIEEIEQGLADREDNVLKHAPHTSEEVIADGWNHAYAREKAAYPVPGLRRNKFWPSVGRVNDAYGDRNVMCTCPPVEEYASTESPGS